MTRAWPVEGSSKDSVRKKAEKEAKKWLSEQASEEIETDTIYP